MNNWSQKHLYFESNTPIFWVKNTYILSQTHLYFESNTCIVWAKGKGIASITLCHGWYCELVKITCLHQV